MASEEKDKSNKGLGGMELSQFWMPSGLLPVHLHAALVAEPGGMSKVPVAVRDRTSDKGRKASGESLSTPPSRAGRDASSGKKPRLWMLLLYHLHMGAICPRNTPLQSI